jgi:hypothetical protein
MTILQAIKQATETAKHDGKIFFVYRLKDDSYIVTDHYSDDWIFKAYPGGKRILRVAIKN